MIRALLFDWDGTLLDSIPMILCSLRHTLTKHLGEAPPDDRLVLGIGTPLRNQLEGYARQAGREGEEIVDTLVEGYLEHNLKIHDQEARLFPGILESLKQLLAQGLSLGIVTSKSRISTLRGLQVTQSQDLFELLICSDDLKVHKPDPAPVRLALERLALKPEEAIYIGDSPHDMRSGRGAGVLSAAVRWSPFPEEELLRTSPDLWLDKPADLLKLSDQPRYRSTASS